MKPSTKGILLVLLCFVVIFLHYTVQFVSWAELDRIDHNPGELARIGWAVFSFPLFYVLPDVIINTYFEIILILNSLLWGVAVYAFLIFRLLKS